MMTNAQPGPAMTFAELHAGPHPLLLPNAWDIASALAYVDAGFAAVGTTSFGVNGSLGQPDGASSSRNATRELVMRIRSLPVHVTADIEDGYSDDASEVAAYVEDLGVAGVNLEDSRNGGLVEPSAVAAKVTAIKRTVPNLFVNARVDTYWFHIEDSPEATIDRAMVYVDAGADGIFVPGAAEARLLERLARSIPVPVNVLASPDLTLEQLGELGIRRVSTGSLPFRAAIDAAVHVAEVIREGGTAPSATSYADMQRRFEEFAGR